MKHFFFVDQSDFLTNFLDLASSELRKPAKAASLVKLQSLLDLAVRNPASSSSNDPNKDDLKVTMQSQGLYDWLMKIVSRTGSMNEDGELDFAMEDRDDDAVSKKSDKERPLLGECEDGWIDRSHRCHCIRLYRQVSLVPRCFPQNHHPVSTHLSFPAPLAPPRIGAVRHVAGAQGAAMAQELWKRGHGTVEESNFQFEIAHAFFYPTNAGFCHGRGARGKLENARGKTGQGANGGSAVA